MSKYNIVCSKYFHGLIQQVHYSVSNAAPSFLARSVCASLTLAQIGLSPSVYKYVFKCKVLVGKVSALLLLWLIVVTATCIMHAPSKWT